MMPLPSVPGRIGLAVARTPDGCNSLRALRAFRPGEILCRLALDSITNVAERHTVQIGPDTHALVDPVALRFTNHSCDPNVVFDTDRGCVRAIRAIPAGEEITFFYPATEWHMAEPFRCRCGSDRCLGTIAGAECLPAAVLAEYDLSGHISQLLAAREAARDFQLPGCVSADPAPASRAAPRKERPH